MIISTRMNDSTTRLVNKASSCSLEIGCFKKLAIFSFTASLSNMIGPPESFRLSSSCQVLESFFVFLSCFAIDFLIGFPEAFQRSIDQIFAIFRFHQLESVMDPLNVPLLVDHDFGKRFPHGGWDLFDLAVPGVLVDNTLFEYLCDGKYLHQVARRSGSR